MSLRLDAPLIHSLVNLPVWEPLVGPNIVLVVWEEISLPMLDEPNVHRPLFEIMLK